MRNSWSAITSSPLRTMPIRRTFGESISDTRLAPAIGRGRKYLSARHLGLGVTDGIDRSARDHDGVAQNRAETVVERGLIYASMPKGLLRGTSVGSLISANEHRGSLRIWRAHRPACLGFIIIG